MSILLKNIECNENGTMWFDIDGKAFGYTLENEFLDEDGIPYSEAPFNECDIDEIVGQLVEWSYKDMDHSKSAISPATTNLESPYGAMP